MKYLEYVYERHQKITNIVGTILVAWILSALFCNMIGWFLPSTNVSIPSAVASSNTVDDMGNFEQRDIAYYMPICEKNIFDSMKQSPCDTRSQFTVVESDEPQIDLNADPVKSSINAKLLGTMVSTNEKYSFATVNEPGKKEALNYRINDLIAGEGKIYAIERNRVYFTVNGRKEYLEVDRLPSIYRGPPLSSSGPTTPSAGVKVDGNKVTVSKAKVDSTLQDLNQVIQQARMVPNYENGQVDGFKIFGIRNGSIFQDLGLQNGDVINNINGTQIDSLEKALPMLQLLKTESSYTIDITRKGAKQTMSINIQ